MIGVLGFGGSALFAAPEQPAVSGTAQQQQSASRISDLARLSSGSGSPPASSLEAGESEGDALYGVQNVLYRRDNWFPWNIRLDNGVYHSSNVALSPTREIDDVFYHGGVSVGYTPKISGNLFGSLLLSDHVYRYDEHSEFDFDLYDAEIGLLYATQRHGSKWGPAFDDVNAYARYGYYRVTRPWDLGDSSFDNHSAILGAQKNFRPNSHLHLYLGIMGDLSLEANREEPRRHEYAAYTGAVYDWSRRFKTSASYRIGYYDYFQEFFESTGAATPRSLGERADWNHTVSLSAEYKIRDWLRAYTSVSATFNESNISFFDYENLNVGASLGISLEF